MTDPARAVVALHRYFLQANQMRARYDEHLLANGAARMGEPLFTEQYIYLCLWYGCLYVVVEGWWELGLTDSVVDELLEAPNVELLRKFRNGAFHFQRSYWDSRFLGFITKGASSAVWVRDLNAALGHWFLRWFEARR